MRIIKFFIYGFLAIVGIPLLGSAIKDLSKQPLASVSSDNTASLAPSNSEIATIRKSKVTYDYDQMWYMTITSKLDNLNITHVRINRGNCKASFADENHSFPRPLLFGQSVKLLITHCNPIEVSLQAAEGSDSFTLTEY